LCLGKNGDGVHFHQRLSGRQLFPQIDPHLPVLGANIAMNQELAHLVARQLAGM
jgi:hypothetical protein